jgi:DnaJ-class molecular chaperone
MTPTLAAITLLTAITLGYGLLCAAAPFRTCRRCHGFGFATHTDRRGRPKRGKTCRRCRGTGARIRAGRWAFNRWQRAYRDGTR